MMLEEEVFALAMKAVKSLYEEDRNRGNTLCGELKLENMY